MNDAPSMPRATAVWIEYLTGKHSPVRVAHRTLPDPKFIKVSRIGGVAQDLVTDFPTMGIEVYDTDADLAEQFATAVRRTIHRSRGTLLVPGVVCKRITEYSGPYADPDENHDSYRFSWTFGSALRAT